MTEVTTIQTRIGRKIIVTNDNRGRDVFIDVNDTSSRPDDGRRVFSMLEQGEAKQVATALLGNNAVVITDLPEVTRDEDGWLTSGSAGRYEDGTPEKIEETAKGLLSIAKFIRTRNAEKEAAAEAAEKAEAERLRVAEEAKEAKLTERRNKIAEDLSGYPGYESRTTAFKRAIDRIIELEDALAPAPF